MEKFPFSWFIGAFTLYSILLFLVTWLTNRRSEGGFYKGNKAAPWPVVAYGMIGASVTGVTFISVPGNVWNQNFFYIPMVLGFVAGYIIIARLLLPLYYRMNLTSIYSYLGDRFGQKSMQTGTVAFMISRLLGAAVRIYVVIVVFMFFVPKILPPFALFCIIAIIFLSIIYIYTCRGGVKTIIWTDVFQTSFMLLAVGIGIVRICRYMDVNAFQMLSAIGSSDYSTCFDWNWSHGTNAVKQFISGIVVTIAMTGLDQAMMQKNLACKDLKAAQKNMYMTGVNIAVVICFFLLLGALLCIFAESNGGFSAMGITKSDQLFPAIASQYLGRGVALFFLLGLISASYPSTAAAMTSLTTSVCFDFLDFARRQETEDSHSLERTRLSVQAFVAMLLFVIMLLLFILSNDAVINLVYKLASYTYGPLLGIFFFGIFTHCRIHDNATPFVAIFSPMICLGLNVLLKSLFGFDLGFSLLLVNGLVTFTGMWLCREN